MAPCSEFPNDNPGLHLGALWMCPEVLGAPSCELRELAAPEPDATPVIDAAAEALDETPELEVLALEDCDEAATDEDDDLEDPIEIVDDLSLDGAVDESESIADPFLKFVAALEETARSLGAGQDQLSCIRALFGVTRWEAVDPGAPAIEALVAAQIVVKSESARAHGVTRGREFTEQVLAWQGILRGESEDFALCTALDEWAADVVARVMGSPARTEGIRRELRRLGVAAFGLVADAA